jgi:hypothetical protein
MWIGVKETIHKDLFAEALNDPAMPTITREGAHMSDKIIGDGLNRPWDALARLTRITGNDHLDHV